MGLEKYSLDGEVAIVTGAGSGLGKAMTMALARAGADLVLVGRRPEPLDQTAAEIRALGRQALVVPTDVTKSDQVANLVDKAGSKYGKIDILVNNAGIARGVDVITWDLFGGGPPPIWTISDEGWHWAQDQNLGTTFFTTRAVAKHFIERKKGKVINISSGAGFTALRGNFTYCSAKAGVQMLTKTMAITWARDNVQVNCIAPVFLVTMDVPEEVLQTREKYTPIRRRGDANEIGPLAVFLASRASDYVTGEVFIIDGGGIAGYGPGGFEPLLSA